MSTREPLETSYDKAFDLSLWRKLLGYVRPHKRITFWFLFCGAVLAGVDVAFPLVTRAVIDDVTQQGTEANLVPYAWMYLGLTVALSTLVIVFIRLGGRLRTRISHDIRRDAFANLQDLSFSYYDHRPVGWLMARMTSDCDRLANIMAWGALDYVWGLALMTGITVVLFVLNAKLALIVLTVIPLLAWISTFFQKRILKSSRKVRKTNSRLTAAYNEGIMGVRTSKVFVREEKSLEEFQELSGEMRAASVRNQLQSALYLPIVMTLGSLATGLALAFGGFDVASTAITIGTLIAFLNYTAHFFDPIQEMAQWFAEIQMAQASAERVMGLIEEVPEIQDSEEVRLALAAGPLAPGLAPDGKPDSIDAIEFRDVSFVYRGGQRVLDGFDLTVRAGETIALVGPTGGGKSTIVNLLCRFYEPTDGEIRIDGVDYRKRSLKWLQSNLGIVLQTPHLFSGTILENLRYGHLDATDAEIVRAAKLVGAHEFIVEMDKGYDSEVGEGGNRLSTGQKQLLSFARAILAQPRILVMDEATSSVDTETEKRIQSALEKVLRGRTSFVIAHRLSTIRAADRILVIEKGTIVEQGTHAELLASRGSYYDLYTNQSLVDSVRDTDPWTGPQPEVSS